jgi:hypothetical protein
LIIFVCVYTTTPAVSMLEFLKRIIKFFYDHDIKYMLSGSVALSVYTIPRTTRDFDFVVHLKPKDIKPLADHFEKGYYCDFDSVKDAVQAYTMFNIIDYASGFKADFVILKNEPYRQIEFSRRKEIDFYGMPVFIVSPEDLLLSKLIWIQQFQSNIQMEDIKNLARLQDLDWSYIRQWINTLKLNTFNLF